MELPSYPRCCLSCILLRLRFPNNFIRYLINTGLALPDILDMTHEDLAIFPVNITEGLEGLLKTIVRDMINDFWPASAPRFHTRYYQREMVPTGRAGLDGRLSGGLRHGMVYAFFEPRRDVYRGDNIIREILVNAQLPAINVDRVLGLTNAIQHVAFISTGGTPLPFAVQEVAAVRHFNYPIDDNQDPRTVNHENVGALFDFFNHPERPGVVVVDVIRFFRNFEQAGQQGTDPSINQWLNVMINGFGRIDDMIIILMVDESLFHRYIPERNRIELACRGLPATTNLMTIEMNNTEPEFWHINQFTAPVLQQEEPAEEIDR